MIQMNDSEIHFREEEIHFEEKVLLYVIEFSD